MLWKNLVFDSISNFNWINSYSPPDWDEIVKVYDFAVSTFGKMLKRITNRDDLRALSCKNIIEERCLDGGRNTAPVKILGQKYLYILI